MKISSDGTYSMPALPDLMVWVDVTGELHLWRLCLKVQIPQATWFPSVLQDMYKISYKYINIWAMPKKTWVLFVADFPRPWLEKDRKKTMKGKTTCHSILSFWSRRKNHKAQQEEDIPRRGPHYVGFLQGSHFPHVFTGYILWNRNRLLNPA